MPEMGTSAFAYDQKEKGFVDIVQSVALVSLSKENNGTNEPIQKMALFRFIHDV